MSVEEEEEDDAGSDDVGDSESRRLLRLKDRRPVHVGTQQYRSCEQWNSK